MPRLLNLLTVAVAQKVCSLYTQAGPALKVLKSRTSSNPLKTRGRQKMPKGTGSLYGLCKLKKTFPRCEHRQVSAGGDHALISHDAIYALGDNRYGQLGAGHNEARLWVLHLLLCKTNVPWQHVSDERRTSYDIAIFCNKSSAGFFSKVLSRCMTWELSNMRKHFRIF